MTPSFCIGPYALEQTVNEHPDLRRISWWGKLWVVKRAPAGQVMYRPHHGAKFLGVEWKLLFGVVNGRIWTIHALWVTKSKSELEAKIVECMNYCSETFGGHVVGSKQHAAQWQTDFGTVSLNAQSVIISGREALHNIRIEAKVIPTLQKIAENTKN